MKTFEWKIDKFFTKNVPHFACSLVVVVVRRRGSGGVSRAENESIEFM